MSGQLYLDHHDFKSAKKSLAIVSLTTIAFTALNFATPDGGGLPIMKILNVEFEFSPGKIMWALKLAVIFYALMYCYRVWGFFSELKQKNLKLQADLFAEHAKLGREHPDNPMNVGPEVYYDSLDDFTTEMEDIRIDMGKKHDTFERSFTVKANYTVWLLDVAPVYFLSLVAIYDIPIPGIR